MDPLNLTDGVLLLRPAVPADVPALLAACKDPDIGRWTTLPTPYTQADADRWVRHEVPAGWAAETHLSWLVTPADDPEHLLASVGLHHLDVQRRDGEIGYWAAPAARGRGVVTAAVGLVLRWAFEELGLERVDWEAGVGNEASLRVAEKVGITVEGVARSRHVVDGHRHDGWLGGILAADLLPSDRPAIASVAPVAADAEEVDGPAPAQPWPLPSGVEITAGALHLRPFGPHDLAGVVATVVDPSNAQWNPFDRTETPEEDAAAYIARNGDAAADPAADFVQLAVADATSGELLGGVVLSHVDRQGGTAEVGYWTVPTARGRGVARRAVGTMSRWAFAELGLERIDLWHAVGNIASCRVADAAGYAYELTTRSSWRYGDGARHDEHLHSRLVTDPEPS